MTLEFSGTVQAHLKKALIMNIKLFLFWLCYAYWVVFDCVLFETSLSCIASSNNKKSCIKETKHFSTDAESSTDTKKILLERQNLMKFFFLLNCNFTPFMNKSFQILDHFFPLLFPKNFENEKSLDIGLYKRGAKRRLNRAKIWKNL